MRPTSKPWLTLHYDEYINVMERYIELLHQDAESNDVTHPEGEPIQAHISGPRQVRPTLHPRFTPNRCIREEEGTEPLPNVSTPTPPPPSAEEVNAKHIGVKLLYHMCRSLLYERAKSTKVVYFPPTLVGDGRFTHAMAVPSRLVTTANHFYADAPLDDLWICLEFDWDVLEKRLGIVTIFEGARPVEDTDTDKDWTFVCPHIYGGIPVHVEGMVTNVFKMHRGLEDGTFLGINGLVWSLNHSHVIDITRRSKWIFAS
ncbi:hypothetical protein ACHAXA_009431 [Cyclostephanos tholiformis]|uniref:Uncharacterized protein n=1 Tax=Cyclostephanos tholiformis TaxID=382380 RepID=A0ABD3RNA5_9STRA